MKRKLSLILLIALICTGINAQEQQKKSAEELAIEQANKMESELKLEPHQTFYVDSILCRNYREWMDEIDALRGSGVQEQTVYISVKDKWNAVIDSALIKVLTPTQWTEYLKMTGKYKKIKKEKAGKK